MIEPTIDEARFQQAQRAARVSALRGTPLDDDSCANCLYFLEPGAEMAFCWQEKLQMLVGSNWWCQYWEMTEDA